MLRTSLFNLLLPNYYSHAIPYRIRPLHVQKWPIVPHGTEKGFHWHKTSSKSRAVRKQPLPCTEAAAYKIAESEAPTRDFIL